MNNVYYLQDWFTRTLRNGDERGFGFSYVVSAENKEDAEEKLRENFEVVGKVTVTLVDISKPLLVEETF